MGRPCPCSGLPQRPSLRTRGTPHHAAHRPTRSNASGRLSPALRPCAAPRLRRAAPLHLTGCNAGREPRQLGARARRASTRAHARFDAKAFYAIESWDEGTLDVGEATGELQLRVPGPPGRICAVSLREVVAEAEAHGCTTPLLVRAPSIAVQQMRKLLDAFDHARQRFSYDGRAAVIYPIKCNADHEIIRALLAGGAAGLEVGSVAELAYADQLIAQTARAGDRPFRIVCHGWKDNAYLDAATAAARNGARVCVVLESASEAARVCSHGILEVPGVSLGVRLQLSSAHDGHWGVSSGESSKFGLGPCSMTHVLDIVRGARVLDKLDLLHFHLGSQIPDIAVVKDALREASQYFAELVGQGAPISSIDVGGGLPAGGLAAHSPTTPAAASPAASAPLSPNYDVQAYANDVVAALSDICTRRNLAPPHIDLEHGRYLVAPASLLVVDVVERRRVRGREAPRAASVPPGASDATTDACAFLLATLREVREDLRRVVASGASDGAVVARAREARADAAQFRKEGRSMFGLGLMTLGQRAQLEALCGEIEAAADQAFDERSEALDHPTEVYMCNFSVFRSLPDAWALQQAFPVVPVTRLNEAPTQKAVVVDLTCDSDGQLPVYVPSPAAPAPGTSLWLHEVGAERYLLAVLLEGAYQQALGSGHNGVGTMSTAYVRCSGGDARPYRFVPGERVRYSHGGVAPGSASEAERASGAKQM
ncbi:unnamed protein product [Pedinophyceae sp. YPF-701]|nr:unnamed protein product [Pedinophyceae sp. YPF-701]